MYNIDTTNWDLIYILLCSDKLPAATVTLWEQTFAAKTSVPKWSHLNDFPYERFRTLESVAENSISDAVNSGQLDLKIVLRLKRTPLKYSKLKLRLQIVPYVLRNII